MARKRKVPTTSKRASAERRKPVGGPVPRPEPTTHPGSTVPVVGIGASAGGLEAFSQLLHALPPKPGVAIILVPHLAPQHESALPNLLSARTTLPVVQASEGVRVEANTVYVIPPNVQMGMIDDRLHLMPRPADRSQYTPIDFFLRSLADAVQDRAIAVILSGTASDGTFGVREVKAAGGTVLAQKPETAKYDGMPRAAIATGVVDIVLPPEEIAGELARMAHHPLARAGALAAQAPADGDVFRRIFTVLRRVTGVDFSRYKRPTIERRLHRRMVLHKRERVEQYLALLEESPAEVQQLYRDVLIHVTRFFREPESFDTLRSTVFPKILEGRGGDQPVRVWVPGCSTGEEAYSIAIALLEFLSDQMSSIPIQVFATDVDEASIDHARTGLYPEGIAADVAPERLRRFFARVDGGYRITKAVRDLCVFARQDLTRDAPFSKIDLIVCRNVLIYLGLDLQKKVMSIFHYALRPAGFLVLGAAETVGLYSELFSAGDKRLRIYEKKLVSSPHGAFPVEHQGGPPVHERKALPVEVDQSRQVITEANRVVQDRFAPPSVVVDQDLQIVQFRGQTGAFLEPAPGDPSLSLLKMAREGMLHGLRNALHDARRRWTAVRREGLRVRADGRWREVDIHAIPLGRSEHPHFLVLFDDRTRRAAATRAGAKERRGRRPRGGDGARKAESRQLRLEQELASSREYLQSIIQELEVANEELQSANEEILSSNEELQSTNKELDTAKEELQSTNEELNTVNEELNARNEELTRANSDLVNLLGSVNIAIVIVGTDLAIRRFTPMAQNVLNLIASDIGRPIGNIKPNIDCPDLENLIVRVIDTVAPFELEVRDRQGSWFLLRIRPYKNLENRIDGAVLTLFDIQPTKRHEEELRLARACIDDLVRSFREPIALVDAGLRVRALNDGFARALGAGKEDAVGHPLPEVGDGAWNRPELQTLLERIVHAGGSDRLELGEGKNRWIVEARRLPLGDGEEAVVLVTLEDAPSGAPGAPRGSG